MRTFILAGVALLALGVSPALAQDVTPIASTGRAVNTGAEEATATVEEVLVTAQKRKENLQDVPTSVSVVSADVVREQRLYEVSALETRIPGIRINARSIFIRGVGLADFNAASSSSVGTYIDGVLIGSPISAIINYFDIAQIEVLRGPQGTLYGRNTNGGAINITTKQPTFDYQADGSLTYGSYGTVNINGGVGGPVTDKLAFRVGVQLNRDDGVVYNRTTGDDVNFIDNMSGRISLLYRPTENLEIIARGTAFHNRGDQGKSVNRGLRGANCGPATYYTTACSNILGYSDGDGDLYAIDSNLASINKVDYRDASIQARLSLGTITATSITAFEHVERDQDEDTDQSAQQLLEINYKARDNQFTQEFRLESPNTGRFRWVAGLFYLHGDLKDQSSTDLLRALRPMFTTPTNPTGYFPAGSVRQIGYPYMLKTDSYAVFGQSDFDITDRLTLTTGLRYSSDTKDFNYAQTFEYGTIKGFTYANKKAFSDWSGRLALRYKVDENIQVYGSASRGYKSGGFFGGSADNVNQLAPYDNEHLNAYEAGVKSELFDRRVRINVAGFYYDYTNQQVFTQVLRNGVTVLVLDNAAGSTIYGGELEVTARPTENLSLQGTVALLHTKFDNYVTTTADYTGNELPNAPKLNFSGRASYDFDLPNGGVIRPSGDVTLRSQFYTTNANIPRLSVPHVWTVGAQVGYVFPNAKAEVAVFVRNLTNKTYITSIANIESLGYDLVNISRPRLVGVTLNVSY